MLPTDTNRSRPGRLNRQDVAAHEIRVFGHDGAAVKVRKAADFRVGRAVARRKIAGVDGVVPDGAQAAREPTRQLRVDEEPHAAGGWTRLTCASRAANARAASTSSRSRSS